MPRAAARALPVPDWRWSRNRMPEEGTMKGTCGGAWIGLQSVLDYERFHPCFQRLQPAVVQAELAQVLCRLEQVVAAATDRPGAGSKVAGDRFVAERRCIALVLAVDAEGDRRLRPLRRMRNGPHRAIRLGEHLAAPQNVELGRRRR